MTNSIAIAVLVLIGALFAADQIWLHWDLPLLAARSMDDFIDGLDNIVETQRRVALNYFEDGSIDAACPPLKAILSIMAFGEYEGKDERDPDIRALFKKENVLASGWR